MEVLDLGEAPLDALIRRVALLPCGDAELFRPLSDIAPSRGDRFGSRVVAVELLDKVSHGDTESEGGYLEGLSCAWHGRERTATSPPLKTKPLVGSSSSSPW